MAKKINKLEGSFSAEEGKGMAEVMNDLLKKTDSVKKVMQILQQSGKDYAASLTRAGTATDKLIEKLQASGDAGYDLGNRLSNIQSSNKDIEKSFLVQNYALQRNLKVEEAAAELARQDFVKQTLKLKLTQEEREEILKQYDTLRENLKIQEDQTKVAERLKAIDGERSELMESINEKAAIAKLILTDQRALAAAGIATLIKGYDSVKETFGEFRKEGLSVGQAMKETGVGVGAMFSLSGASLKENAELMSGFASSMGDTTKFSRDTVVEVGQLAKTLGLGMKEAGELQGQLQNMAGATAESATSTMEFAGALAIAAHVAPGAIMKDMAANAEDIAVNTKNGGKDMAVVSVAAHKLGVEMSSLTKMSAGLLDFENSINKQMEASVLLGKEINLDKAREAALNGDILGATKEMLQNVGGEAEFNKMNVIQRKALADSMGVSVSDLSKMVKNQDELANLTEEQNQALADGVPLSDVLAANAGGFAGKLKDGALGIAGIGATVSEISGGFKDAKEMASGLFGGIKNGLAGMKDGGGIKGGIKSMFGGKKIEAPPEIPKTDALADSGKKMSGGGMMSGFKKNMKALASGFKEMGQPGVAKGALVTILAAAALIAAVAGLPFLALFGTFPYASLKKNFTALADGLSNMGTGPVALGSLNLMLFAAAGKIGLEAIPFMVVIAIAGKFIGAGLKGLAGGLKALGNPEVALGILMLSVLVLSVGAGMMMFGIGVGIAAAGMSLLMKSIGDMPIENLLIMPIALTGIAIGLGLLAVAAMLAAPGLILASVGLAMMILPLAALSIIASTGAINMLGNGLKLMGDAGPGLGLVALSMMGIGVGLGMVALAGLAAMPIIGMLIALAVVAPALVGLGAALGGMFGGEGGGKKEDKMDTLIAKIDTLIGVASKGGVINMDGKKVGEVIRQGLNSTGIR